MKLIEIDKSRLFSANRTIETESVSKKEIAIIGLAGRFANAATLEKFWDEIRAGRDFIRAYPGSRRKDSDRFINYLRSSSRPDLRPQYNDGAYLEGIDQFDPQFFNLSPTEAGLMDPHQRIFLETVWAAMEDAGYGGNRLSGTKTGVFVGHSSDFGYEYRYLVNLTAPSQAGLSVPGNIQSIIASRIAYLLDLKGPSLLVNTACSSALAAIHLACRSIRSGECEMALAGAVKVNLAPLQADPDEDGIGIIAPDGRARTFDDSSVGTGIGEGAGAVLLKPLNQALADGDQIYAVIKGSAMNQDGSSVGITAPNSAAQEEVILQAWKDADVPPETIAYIEAHGTGTKLGDPIEIHGIQKAFRHYTNRSQFCAVASVKTNVGHLDHAAGIVAVIKAVLALRNRQIPPSLHFVKPNRKINFPESPVYVNDRLTLWEEREFPRRCGISSFGLSGTNCHLVLEEAPQAPSVGAIRESPTPRILAISAKNADSLKELVKQYRETITNHPTISLADLCYTANTGRGHYQYRVALVCESLPELQKQLTALTDGSLEAHPDQGIFYDYVKLVSSTPAKLMEGEISETQKRGLDQEAGTEVQKYGAAADTQKADPLRRIAALYVKGADIPWEALYNDKHQKISLPVYPFKRRRCWCEPEVPASGISNVINESQAPFESTQPLHPLLDRCLAETMGMEIYLTRFSAGRHWVLSEHRVAGSYVVPGTTYLEMAAAIGRRHYPGMALELKDVFFMTPLAVTEDEIRDVQTIIRIEREYCGFTVLSRVQNSGDWITHAEGKIYGLAPAADSAVPESAFGKILADFKQNGESPADGIEETPGAVETGPRWESFQKVYLRENQALAYFELKNQFAADLQDYRLHPAMMDNAANVGIRSAGAGLYLPFGYRSFKIFGPLPGKLWSYLRKNTKTAESRETVSFEVTLWDESGAVIGEIEEYIIKRVPEESLRAIQAAGRRLYYELGWIPKPLQPNNQKLTHGLTLIFQDEKGLGAAMGGELRQAGNQVVEVAWGREYQQISEWQFTIRPDEAGDYQLLCAAVQERGLSRIIHLGSITGEPEASHGPDFETRQKRGLESLFHLSRALIGQKIPGPVALVLVADLAQEVTKKEARLNPVNAAFFGLGKVIGQEHENLKLRRIDIDGQTTTAMILEEISFGTEDQVAYRDGNRYGEEFRSLDLSRVNPKDTGIDGQGVYIITGGTGGLGLEAGKYLADKGKVNLCLLNRSRFPEREAWAEILNANEEASGKMAARIKAIQEIEANGSEVGIYQADVTDRTALQEIFNTLRAKYGRIKGIVHCAGVAGDGFIFRKEPGVFKATLKPKIQGTLVLDDVTRNDQLDFMVLFSSVTGFLGGPGQGDYTAANSFLDAFAAYRNQRGARTLAIDWPAWRETGMAVDYGVQNAAGVFKSITTANAIRAFDEVLHRDLNRVIIGELDAQTLRALADQGAANLPLAPELQAMIFTRGSAVKGGPKPEKRQSGAGIAVTGKAGADINEIERDVARIWSEVLGLEAVNLNDNFYQLGGDSILATRLLKEMEKSYAGLVDITDIFTYVTIAEMAAFLEQKIRRDQKAKEEKTQEVDLDQILIRLANGEITPDEADRLMNLK